MNRNIDSQLLSGLLSGLVIGAAVGVTVGYLVATKKRGPLSDELNELIGNVKDGFQWAVSKFKGNRVHEALESTQVIKVK